MRLNLTSLRTAGLLCALALPLPALAQTLSAEDQLAVETTVAEFNEAFSNRDLATVMGAMPPGMKLFIADNAGITTAELDEALITQTETAMAEITIESFGMDLGAATNDLTNGDRPYMMIPTTTVMSADALGRIRSQSTTLAIKEEGAWYLVRIDNASQISLLTDVYPDFKNVEFPTGSIERLSE